MSLKRGRKSKNADLASNTESRLEDLELVLNRLTVNVSAIAENINKITNITPGPEKKMEML